MKRYFFIVAAVALATVSCSRNYDVNPASEQSISFGSWTENLTKARTQGTNTFTAGDDFAVYGFKLNGSTNNVVFDDITVSASGSPLVWDYVTGEVPARYWDPSATSYTFYGVSPAAIGKAADVNPETGVITSADVIFAGNDNDILVADKKVVTKTGTPAAFAADSVRLQFNHIASLVDFKVKKHTDLATATVAVTSFSISEIDKTGTFGVSAAYTDTHPVVTWSESAYGTYDNTSGVGDDVTLPTNVTSEAAGNNLINNLIVMPQDFRTDGEHIQKVNIVYTITDGSGKVSTYNPSFNLKLFDNIDNTVNTDTIIAGWAAGKHYTFYITINANKINFTGSVTSWGDVINGYNYLLN